MNTYTVYRADFLNKTNELYMVPIGSLTERREKERVNNVEDMFQLAQNLYAESSIDKLHIIISPE